MPTERASLGPEDQNRRLDASVKGNGMGNRYLSSPHSLAPSPRTNANDYFQTAVGQLYGEGSFADLRAAWTRR
jgi:hypothetical protein